MLELSPLLTAAKASRVSMPAAQQHVPVEADAGDRACRGSPRAAAEASRLLVDDGHRVPARPGACGQRGPDAAAPHDHDVHGRQTLDAVARARLGRHCPGRTGRGHSLAVVPSVVWSLASGCSSAAPSAASSWARPCCPSGIALPVFASDALSSVAYAPQEILLVLSLGGVAFYTYAPWVAAAVVVMLLVVVASYRQNVHAYPSGGGDYEVVTTNLGPARRRLRGQRAAGRLRADRGGVDLVGGGQHRLGLGSRDRRPQGRGGRRPDRPC